MKHYHIRWGDSKVDWEAFQTEGAAKAAAEQLKRPGEIYAIEQHDGRCHRCAKLKPAYLVSRER